MCCRYCQSCKIFLSLKVMKPLSETTMPRIHFIKVVLPLPFGPINAMHSPLAKLTETSSRAISFPKRFVRSEEHTSELQSHVNLVCRLLLEKKKPTEHSRRCHRVH